MSQPTRISQATLKYVAKLTQKKYRRSEGKFVIEGARLVEEALNSDWDLGMLLVDREILSKGEGVRALKAAEKRNCPVYEISQEEVRKLSDTVTSQGIIAVVSMKEYIPDKLWPQLSRKSLIVGLDGISDPGNVGTMLRTCDWFGIDAVLIDGTSVDLYSPKVMRSAMGSIFHLPVFPDVDLLQQVREAKKHGFRVFVTTASGVSSNPAKLPSGKLGQGMPDPGEPHPAKSMFIFGNEARGVRPEIMREADGHVSIPKFGKAESLNVAIACGVILSGLRLPGRS